MSLPVAVPSSSRDGDRTSIHEPLSQSLSSDSGGKGAGGDDRKSRRTSLQVLLTKMPAGTGSSESLNYGTPVSPGSQSWLDVSIKNQEMPSPDKGGTTPDSGKLTRKESYKAQRKNYRREKKRVANELLSSLKDPSVIILADWLKVRGTLKSWSKLWCVLKPGLLLLYKSPKTKSNHWVGTVLLNTCQVIERPSKKDGFCFKLFHPLEQSIWAPRGPEKETLGAVIMPLPTSYLIFRASSQAAGKCWLDALELGLRCSSLLVRSSSGKESGQPVLEQSWEYEQHFTDQVSAEENCMLGTLLHTFLPATPNTPRSLAQLKLPINRYTPSPANMLLGNEITPVPSPTPFFHQLYAAVSCLEKELYVSPNKKRGRSMSADMGKPRSSIPLKFAGRKSLDVNIKLAAPSDVELLDFVDTEMPEERIDCVNEQGDSQLPHHHHHHHNSGSDTESDVSDAGKHDDLPPDELEDEPEQTLYVENEEEEFGSAGEQVEELAEENKSLIWFLMKQVRPGMDLSKVVLPTFILEPRSFLDKLSDSYYHVDILSQAVLEEDAFTRMKTIVRWYLSGLYKKPKGLKKPYNPVLGESFRCYWKHANGSKTFYIAEQVSHHPPVSAFYVTNRQDGFCISASILAKSKFYGNSTSAILDGIAVLTLLPRGEDYTVTIPYAHCKGILMGTLTMELGGKVAIECEKTGYKTEIEFKLKPFLGGAEHTNAISGRLKLGKETLATIDGYWDGNISIRDRRTGEEQLLWCPTTEVRAKRLKRCTVPLHDQGEFESERLWQHVSAAIARDDQVAATEEKTVLEEAQRAAVKERKAKCIEWIPKYFEQDLISGQWMYRHSDLRPWDTRNDLFQYECDYVIQTKTRHKTPMIRTSSIVSVDPQTLPLLAAESRELKVGASRRRGIDRDSGSSTPDGDDLGHSESSQSDSGHGSHQRLQAAIQPLEQILNKHSEQLDQIKAHLKHVVHTSNKTRDFLSTRNMMLLILIVGSMQAIFMWLLLTRK